MQSNVFPAAFSRAAAQARVRVDGETNMKITLDLDLLVTQGKLNAAEAERLKGLAAADTGALGSNIFLAFGIVAVALGAGVFIPTVETAIVVGALLFGVGYWLTIGKVERWLVFSQIAMVLGALAFTGGVATLFGDIIWVKYALVLALAGAAVAATSGLLASLSVFLFAGAILTGTDLWQPTVYLTLAIVSLSALVLVLYLISVRLPHAYERLAIIAMRTAILMVNAAFLIGSIFGDGFFNWPNWGFTIAWTLALLAFGTWAVFANRRWVVNTVAVFAAIHFFTQWFMYLGAQPFSILGGGLLLIGFGLLMARFNRWVGALRETASVGTSQPQADGWKA
jgi:iron complex transport system permease protein